MFKLLKWFLIILALLIIWYLAYFFLTMEKSDLQQIKKTAINAIDAEDPELFTGPLKEKIQTDLKNKKQSFFEMLKVKLKNSLDGQKN